MQLKKNCFRRTSSFSNVSFEYTYTLLSVHRHQGYGPLGARKSYEKKQMEFIRIPSKKKGINDPPPPKEKS